jgi:putative salt-induced outer membrane protein YdiY
LVALSGPAVLADQLGFKNGDRLSGSVVKSDDKNLVFKSTVAGDVTVRWQEIQELSTDHQLHVGLADGTTLLGKVTTHDGTMEIATNRWLSLEAPQDSLQVMRNDAEQLAYENPPNKALLRGWEGGLDAGFELTRGNSDTKNFRFALNAAHKTSRDKVTVYAESIYSTDDLPTARPHVSANENKGGARFDREFTPRFFLFANAGFMNDALQDLNLRSVLGGGVGYHLIKRERATLELLGGANFTRESYVEIQRNFAAGQSGEEFKLKLGKNMSLTQRLTFFADLTERESSGLNYRTNFSLGTVTKIVKWLGWQNNFSDSYVTNPPAGKKRNELVFTSGLNLAFRH